MFGIYDGENSTLSPLSILGVGGWSTEYGIDAKAYSEKLASGTATANEEKKIFGPLEMLQFSYEDAKTVKGTSTACLARLSDDNARLAETKFLDSHSS